MKKALMWLLMLWKRLLLKKGFILLLVMIPLSALLINLSASSEHGFITIAVATDSSDELSGAVADELCNDKKAFRFLRCDTEEDAIRLVESLKADAAWVIEPRLAESITVAAPAGKLKIATVYQREENVLLRMAREKLYSAVYPDISYSLYRSYVTEELLPNQKISEEELKEYYSQYSDKESIIDIVYPDGSAYNEKSDYITSPLRGLFVIMLMLCGLASSAYFLSEEKRGVYSLVTSGKRTLIMAAGNLCALITAGMFVTLALVMSGLYTDFWRESLNMILLIITSTLFCTCLGRIIGSVNGLCLTVPIILVTAIVFCPVFVNLNTAKPIQILLPPYHYLNAVYDGSVLWNSVIYSLSATAVCIILGCIRKRNAR